MDKAFLDKLTDIYSISYEEANSLIAHMEPICFKKGSFVVREGQRNSNLYILRSGVIRSFRAYDGEESALWFASEGEVLIQVWGYCKDAPSEENFECETDCELLVISKTQINELCSKSLEFANLFRRIFESHSLIMEEFLIFFSDNKSAEQRYLAMIKQIGRAHV